VKRFYCDLGSEGDLQLANDVTATSQ